jgi:hypothetical protein
MDRLPSTFLADVDHRRRQRGGENPGILNIVFKRPWSNRLTPPGSRHTTRAYVLPLLLAGRLCADDGMIWPEDLVGSIVGNDASISRTIAWHCEISGFERWDEARGPLLKIFLWRGLIWV